MVAAIEVRRFDQPDECLDMKRAGAISIVKMSDGTAGMHAVFEPGWTWEKDEKPTNSSTLGVLERGRWHSTSSQPSTS